MKPSLKEAIEAFRKERQEARERKAIRDAKAWKDLQALKDFPISIGELMQEKGEE